MSFFLQQRPLHRGRRATRVPLTIFVMWHPSFVEGPLLAREIYEWFGDPSSDARTAGNGIPVHFRSAPWTAEGSLVDEEGPPASGPDLGEQRRPIGLHHATHNVFIPLVDDHMIDDVSFRRDLLDLATLHEQCERGTDGPFVHLAPIQLSSSWSRLPTSITRHQALYLQRWADPTVQTETAKDRLQRWRPRLRRLVTQALVRLLREERAQLPTEIFLSHAKIDRALGPGVAEELRDVAAGYGQIDVFYDENDLPLGRAWAPRMLEGGARAGAGFVAILSDRYATRYWCRREVEEARTPRRVGASPVWRIQPSVVAVTLSESWTRLVPDLASVPAIAWRRERATEVFDQLFREALVAEFQLLYAERLHERLLATTTPDPSAPALAFVTWTPDPASLLRLYRENREDFRRGAVILYPGHGFLPTEEAALADALGSDVRLVPYEALSDALGRIADDERPSVREVLAGLGAQPSPPSDPRAWPTIALSAGDSDDLASLGYDDLSVLPKDVLESLGLDTESQGSLHVDAAVLRFCRVLVEGRVRIAYGGTLRGGRSFTALLHEMVSTMALPPAEEADPATPLEGYVPAPFWSEFDARRRAALTGLVKLRPVGNRATSTVPSEQVLARGRALSDMRRIVARASLATLALGGRRRNFAGFMPGVAEELLASMECASTRLADGDPAHVRVLLVGDYGGVARVMARFVLGRVELLPDDLRFEPQRHSAGDRSALAMLHAPLETATVADRYARLAACLEGLRKVAQLPGATPLPLLGVTVDEWRSFLRSSSPGYLRRLLQDKVVPRLRERGLARSP